MIELVNVTQHYGVQPVLRRVNLRIRRGELAVVIGPNGTGKTTLLGVAAGVLSPQSGEVRIDDLRRRRSAEEELQIRRRVVYLPAQAWLPGGLTGREFLLAVGRLYDIHDDRLMEHVERLLKLFDLAGFCDGPIRSLSTGQQKKVALCSALVTEARVMLLDEPFSGGLDPAGLVALKAVLRHRVEREGATVLLASPVPELVEEIADRIVVLRDGEVLAFESLDGLRRLTGTEGSLGQVLERLLHPQTVQNLNSYFEGLPS